MEKYLPAICFHPTTVLLIDDNQKFLDSLQLNLDWSQTVYRGFAVPQNALDFLAHNYQVDPFTNRVIKRAEEDLEHRTLDVDISAIHKEYNIAQRFNEISVLIVDYAMPEMTGLEICRQLKNQAFKKIMLTGEADENIAIKGFNAGLIDRFIRKDVPNFKARILTEILDMQKKYFQTLSAIVVDSLIHNPEQKATFLTDHVFIDFFEDIFTTHKAVEYYLIDSLGSFVFLDAIGHPKWLVIKNQKEMEDLASHAHSENVDHTISDPLTKFTHVPYFHTADELQTPPAQWLTYFHPAQKLVSDNDVYYYAIIDNPQTYKIEENVESFNTYCKKNGYK
jgi:CheY-like chemotaxis protein